MNIPLHPKNTEIMSFDASIMMELLINNTKLTPKIERGIFFDMAEPDSYQRKVVGKVILHPNWRNTQSRKYFMQ